ncbi:hypothetical protein V6N12_068198 [Hibiscus sabdariffa]|uniref:Uncharacterized protein n=1 Tax=Hibiscus sabdariffa TaxID=183260 RepID=A0ABR2FP98_9ROSI
MVELVEDQIPRDIEEERGMQQEHKQILECVNFGVFTRDDNHDYYDGFNDKDDGEINDEEEETVLVPVSKSNIEARV